MSVPKQSSSHSEDVLPNGLETPAALVPSTEEAILLTRLRTLRGNDYEAQYFDNKPVPRGKNYRKLGNPSALLVPKTTHPSPRIDSSDGQLGR